ncbi:MULTISPECIES: ABC transporter permease [Catellatospora]|uniref:ABC transporter n=2 Tax=Catellatospora TaxID=53365 RepID=A0A8J3K2A6_9ACTN|nr:MULTISPECIES: ABC transporter permease [Catellatospora]RKE07219.1 ABC-2 type transport system permease protein [Catellatospora citrea]GIF87005.1 ABC transporter [Catellatospora chokoriensis]GIF95372.1 ABC transporter [Catellatospora citrea]
MRAYLVFELRRLIREPRMAIFTVVLPVLIYTISSGSSEEAGQVGGVDVAAYLMVSMAAYGALVGALSVGIAVSQERANGWLRQLRITPLSPAQVVAVKALLASLLAIPPVVSVGLVAAFAHGVSFSAGQWVALVVLMWLGSLPFAAFGLALGFTLPPQLTQPVSMLGVFGLAFLGGLFVPVAVMPHVLASIATWLPSNRFAELGWSVVAGQAPPVGGVAILAAWALVFGALAAWAYRRSAALR